MLGDVEVMLRCTGPHGLGCSRQAALHRGADWLFHDPFHAAEERFFQKLEAEVDKCGRFTARLVAELRERLKQLQVRLCFWVFLKQEATLGVVMVWVSVALLFGAV